MHHETTPPFPTNSCQANIYDVWSVTATSFGKYFCGRRSFLIISHGYLCTLDLRGVRWRGTVLFRRFSVSKFNRKPGTFPAPISHIKTYEFCSKRFDFASPSQPTTSIRRRNPHGYFDEPKWETLMGEDCLQA